MTPLPIELTCNVTGLVAAWRINGTYHDTRQLLNNRIPGHSLAGPNIQVNNPVNNTEYICVFENDDGNENDSDPAYVVIVGEYVLYYNSVYVCY